MTGQPPDTSLDHPTDSPGSQPDTAPDSPAGVSVAEAARRLGVTSDAIYKGLRRGTYQGEKTRSGEWRVYVDAPDTTRQAAEPSRSAPDAPERATGPSSPDDQTAGLERLVDSLEEQIAFLRAELARRDEQFVELGRQRAEERQRLDVIIHQLEEVRQLPASTETPPTEERRGWWRRLFG